MQQLLSVWMTLDGQRRIVVGISTIAMFLAIIVLSRLATAPSMSLLYSGLEADSAGEVVLALEQRAVRFEIRGSAIFVDGARRDELRMTLASEGLPANSTKGYELLDALTGFGTTAQMFDAAYWRAKEGELARTIVSSPLIRTARVHISNTSSQPFQRAIAPTASVTVSGVSGAVPRSQANALKYLISSAVAGMSPEDVSVIDGRNGVVGSGDDAAGGGTSGGDRATMLRRNVERLLEARVGVGNAVVEVNVETTTESESITERTFDPDTRVAISIDTEERSTNANDSRGGGGAVTVASNLPAGAAGGGDNSS
ncbi:MAG: flagellar M-ring protein FliF C-terminal domain-containing protein, partial [Paracoccaceae bacterium]